MNNYLVYKLSGGLNHMMNAINYTIILSKRLNRKLILDTYGGAFDKNFNDYFHIPNLEYYTNLDIIYDDNSVDLEKYDKYLKSRTVYVKGDYRLHDISISMNEEKMLNNKDKILFISTFNGKLSNINLYDEEEWNIQVNKNTMDRIDKIPKIDGKYLGVHYRNTDMKTDINLIINEIEKKLSDYNKIYLSTDDFKAFNYIRNKIPSNIKIIQYTSPFNAEGNNTHYNNPNKDEVIMNALIDMYFLKNSTVFIPSKSSSFSKRIIFLRKRGGFFD